jgi:hypothetical protein
MGPTFKRLLCPYPQATNCTFMVATQSNGFSLELSCVAAPLCRIKFINGMGCTIQPTCCFWQSKFSEFDGIH